MTYHRTFSFLAAVSLLFAASPVPDRDPLEREVVEATEKVRKRFRLDEFYGRVIDAGGLPVASSDAVSDYALLEAAYLIDRMLDGRDDVRQALARSRVRFVVMAFDEMTTDIPEHSDLEPPQYWDKRARGLGATDARPAVSCGEENLLGYAGDPYGTENILIHEFAHAIHEMGLRRVDSKFDRRLRETYDAAMERALWKDKYAATNHGEYWAEAVQTWFDTNRENDHDHNHVNTRDELREYDPELAALVQEVFGDGEWRYVKPADRGGYSGHLEGYDPSKAPRFEWPAELLEWWKEHPDGGR